MGSIGHTGKTGEFQIARFGSLPWERGTGQKQPDKLSPFEKFLDDINVDRQAKRGMRRSQILQSALVVVTTLSSAGSKTFINAVNNSKNQEFDAVVIDECCQASEPETLIPFKFNPTTVTLVGDPEQLRKCMRYRSCVSLFVAKHKTSYAYSTTLISSSSGIDTLK